MCFENVLNKSTNRIGHTISVWTTVMLKEKRFNENFVL